MAFTPPDLLELTRAAFRQEADELLAELDTTLLQLEAAPDDEALIHRAFRAIHTLKGSGATAGFLDVSSVLHGVEDTLGEAREGRVVVTGAIVDLVLRTTDVVRRILQGEGGDSALIEEGHAAVRALAEHAPRVAAGARPSGFLGAAPAPPGGPEGDVGVYSVRFVPARSGFRSGKDPLHLLRELEGLGVMVVAARTGDVPPLLDLDPELCFLSFEAQLATRSPLETLRSVFALVEAEAEVAISAVPATKAWVLGPTAYFDQETIDGFVGEARENLEELEAEVVALEDPPREGGRMDGIFRALHNLKGQAGLLLSDVRLPPPPDHPLFALRDLCHSAEGLAERHRGEERPSIGAEGAQILLQAVDLLETLLASFLEARAAGGEARALLDRIARIGGPHEAAAAAPVARSVFASVADQCQIVVGSTLRPGERTEDLTPIELKSMQRALQTLARAAAFEGRTVVHQKAEVLISACRDYPSSDDRSAAGERLVLHYRGVEDAIRRAAEGVSPPAVSPPPTPEAASDRPQARATSLRPPKPARATDRAPAAAAADGVASRSLRVDQHKLDQLLRAVGELLVARNSLPTFAKRLEGERSAIARDVKDVGERISRIADDLQSAVMAIRMMPIRVMFQRLPRLVRDLARSEDKQVQLVVFGDDTELDKAVIEQLSDPLVHLVRNAVDHGVETPDERRSAGKREQAVVDLKVTREGSFVVIEIADDGRGLRVEKLRDKAVEKGLLTRAAADALSREATYELVFLPGFSTAEAVTSISGRGVGLDVVRNNVRQLHGTVTVESEAGKGSTFRVKLPASLMVSKAIVVEASDDQYLFPIDSIRELVKLDRSEIHRIGQHRFAHIRGSIVAVTSLAGLLGLEDRDAGGEGRTAAIVRTRLGDVAVIVDRLVAEIDVIVKPLAEGLDRLRLFQGAAILGDGRVALVLDPSQLGAVAQAASLARAAR